MRTPLLQGVSLYLINPACDDEAAPGFSAEIDALCALHAHVARASQGAAGVVCRPIILGLCRHAATEFESLRLTSSLRLARAALEAAQSIGGGNAPLCALPASLAGELLYEQGALHDAEVLLRRYLPEMRASGLTEALIRAYRVLAAIAAHDGRCDAALDILEEAAALGAARDWPSLVAQSLAQQAGLTARERPREAQLYSGRLAQLAGQCSARPDSVLREVSRYVRLTRARLQLTRDASARALEMLQQLHQESLTRGEDYTAVQTAVELAGWLEAAGRKAEADQLLLRTLELGAAAGLHQSFVGQREFIAPCLQRAFRQATERGAPHQLLLSYLASLAVLDRTRTTLARPLAPAVRVTCERLSARETEILRLVCFGESNKSIARALSIAPETVKAHVKRIFIKLDVTSRAAAVYRAGALGLIQLGAPWPATVPAGISPSLAIRGVGTAAEDP